MNIPLFSSWNSRFFHSFRNFLEVHSNSVQNPLSYYSTGWLTGMPNMADDNPYMPGRFITPISQPMNQNLSTLSIGLVSLTAKTPTHWCFNTNSLTNQRGVNLCRFSPVAVVLSWRHPWRTPERKKKLNAPTNQERNCITWAAEKKPERWNGKSSPCFAFESWMWCYWCWFFLNNHQLTGEEKMVCKTNSCWCCCFSCLGIMWDHVGKDPQNHGGSG